LAVVIVSPNEKLEEMDDLWESEQLVICRDDKLALRAVIAVDDTTLGPGLGGVRMRRYTSGGQAIVECRRLAAAMTIKNALAELPFGGAKSVIMAPERVADRTALMRRFGEFVARTGGAYLPGVDMGTSPEDLALIGEGGADVSCSTEDPSPWTALGVAAAVAAAVEHVDRRTGLDGVRVVIQGAGQVGTSLAHELAIAGGEVVIADVDRERAAAVAAAVGGRSLAADDALHEPCDVLAPCAVARVVSAERVAQLRCRIIAGAANDTLSTRADAGLLAQRGITYVPDFIANASGVIHIHALRAGFGEARLRADVGRIGDRVRELLESAEQSRCSPLELAEELAQRALGPARGVGREVAR
jgi:leucine dehydrogenase